MAVAYDFAMVKMHNLQCARCGIPFGIPKDFEERRREDHTEFRCPLGHVNYYPQDTEAKRLKRQLVKAREQLVSQKKRTEWAEMATKKAKEAEQRAKNKTRAVKGHLTRSKKRAAAALCPCCNRSFVQLRRHMKLKHPDFRP